MAGFVGLTSVTAFLVKILTLPIFMKQIKSLEELVSNGYILCGQNESLSFYSPDQDSVCFATHCKMY